jgi:sulfur dioxygenase
MINEYVSVRLDRGGLLSDVRIYYFTNHNQFLKRMLTSLFKKYSGTHKTSFPNSNSIDDSSIKMPPVYPPPSSSTTFVFRQLYDQETSTYTYLLGDSETKKCLLIDPVLEQIERDATLIRELGLELMYGINTHVHADHITGTGLLKKNHFPEMKSVLGKVGNENAAADLKVADGEILTCGPISLEFRSTPGHTNGCHTLVCHEHKLIFTGDTVLIRGCGRTDFQQGNARGLYQVVWDKIFSLPEAYFIYPAHDYKGKTVSTVGEEKQFNPRLTKTIEEFVDIMNNLNLPYPKKIDASVPMNRVCGLHELLPSM